MSPNSPSPVSPDMCGITLQTWRSIVWFTQSQEVGLLSHPIRPHSTDRIGKSVPLPAAQDLLIWNQMPGSFWK